MEGGKQKCGKCKVNLPLTLFKKKRDETYQKTCNNCLEVVKRCKNKSICEHERQKSRCKFCNPNGHLSYIVCNSIKNALGSNMTRPPLEYLGIDIESYRKYIEDHFRKGMSWDNYGEWEIGRIVPLKYPVNNQAPALEDVIERLHYSNTRPIWSADNHSRGNRIIKQ
jgi:hypothetical protein